MDFVRNLFGKKRSSENKGEEFIKIFMDQARKLAKETDTSKYLGPGGFDSVKEMEASFFISLVSDMTSSSDEEIINLVVRHYQLDETKARQFLREFKDSRR